MKKNKIFDKNSTLAVIGVSKDQNKFGYKVYKTLIHNGYNAFPINPKYQEIEGKPCYKNIKTLPQAPELVITVVPPIITQEVVKEANRLDIKNIWMQPGSESKEAIEYCKTNSINITHNKCIIVDEFKLDFFK
ncbi:CoA-binding protein [Patescibacteria group bacterium]